MIDWVQGKNWIFDERVKNLWGWVKPDYGFVHVYALAMTLGILVSVIFCLWKFSRRGLNTMELSIAVIILVPIALMGASFFGKLNADGPGKHSGDAHGIQLLYFWKEGMAIHGGIYTSTFVGLIMFALLGKKTKVSLFTYMDAILPNILWGQVIGRWGNFFNHEVMGRPLYIYNGGQGSLKLPQWILNNTLAVYDGSANNPFGWVPGEIYQMNPIFLWESLSLLAVWIFFVLVVPFVIKLLGNKPWKINPDEYSFDLKFSFKKFFAPWSKSDKKTYKQVWDEAFVFNSNESNKVAYLEKIAKINSSNTNIVKKRWQSGKALVEANNPHHYTVIKAGFEGFAFFFGWNLVRFFLEMERPDDHLFIMYNKPLSLTIIGLTALIGLIGMILTQYGIPQLFRKPGYSYEKEYFGISTPTKQNSNRIILNKVKPAKQNKQAAKEQKALEKLKRLEK
ncbi:diacylglyceryl transferase [Mesoplasma syrphidae]|uniref:Diacylglyceryl transferase n=1 Tax=Mesoplasma syrphidae TaxID=225999 RepID=A0A2K9CDV9_9MOLU|nr:prolipoprotein diacylglyceryl transferase family protein [Mesoplasma syrphidae]AUF83834.1 diacylglyceryl transferase [Mesoplasma syrphidae]